MNPKDIENPIAEADFRCQLKQEKMKQKIKSIEKGWGEGSILFSTAPAMPQAYRLDVIEEDSRQVSNNIIINVYKGYKDGKLIFEMGASIDITVTYY